MVDFIALVADMSANFEIWKKLFEESNLLSNAKVITEFIIESLPHKNSLGPAWLHDLRVILHAGISVLEVITNNALFSHFSSRPANIQREDASSQTSYKTRNACGQTPSRFRENNHPTKDPPKAPAVDKFS